MNITEYREQHKDTNVTADIVERWSKRVVARGLDSQGRAGGAAYLESYGKNISSKKCIKLAVMAENVGANEFASVMWEKAYTIDTGQSETLNADDAQVIPVETAYDSIELSDLPKHLQPGRIATLQPQDGENAEVYINDDRFWAQPKIDGQRMVAILSNDGMYFQKRSLKLAYPGPDINADMLYVLEENGPVVLDGEIYWESILGKEHRTSAQAATENGSEGSPSYAPIAVYAVFDCLYAFGEDITRAPFSYRLKRLKELDLNGTTFTEILPTFQLTATKQELLNHQHDDGKEGVVFRDSASTYVAGKSGTAFRVKFLMDHTLKILGLTETTAENLKFGAIETELGLVGTGFSRADQEFIYENWKDIKIDVVSQGLTENGKLWHARFVGVHDDGL